MKNLTANELNSKCTYAFGNELEWITDYCKTLPNRSKVVMIGAGPGVMALAALEGNSTLDFEIIDNNTHQWVEAHLKAANLFGNNIRFIISDSSHYGTVYTGTPLDFLIVDGDHSYSGVIKDIEAWWNHIKTGAYIFFHDVIDKEQNGTNGVRAAILTILEDKNMVLIDAPGISEVYRKDD